MIWYKYESYIILIHHIQSYTLSLYCTYNSSPRFPMSPLLNLPSPIMPSAATRHIPWEPTTAVRALWPMFEDPSPWGPKPRCSLEILSPKGLLVCNLKTHGFKRREKRPKSSKWRKSIMWTDYNIYIIYIYIYIIYTVRFWDFDGVKMKDASTGSLTVPSSWMLRLVRHDTPHSIKIPWSSMQKCWK